MLASNNGPQLTIMWSTSSQHHVMPHLMAPPNVCVLLNVCVPDVMKSLLRHIISEFMWNKLAAMSNVAWQQEAILRNNFSTAMFVSQCVRYATDCAIQFPFLVLLNYKCFSTTLQKTNCSIALCAISTLITTLIVKSVTAIFVECYWKPCLSAARNCSSIAPCETAISIKPHHLIDKFSILQPRWIWCCSFSGSAPSAQLICLKWHAPFSL